MRAVAGVDVLRLRDFRLVFGAALVSLLGDGMVPVALTFAVLDLTGSATDLGIVLAARTVALVGSLLVGGVVADRVGRRAVMIGADLVRLVAQGAMGVLLVSRAGDGWGARGLAGASRGRHGFLQPGVERSDPVGRGRVAAAGATRCGEWRWPRATSPARRSRECSSLPPAPGWRC